MGHDLLFQPDNFVAKNLPLAIFVQMGLLSLHIAALFILGASARQRQKRLFRLERTLSADLPLALVDTDAARAWLQSARMFEESTLKAFLLARLESTGGDTRHSYAHLYRELGFVRQDVDHLRSIWRNRKRLALRRLSLVAGPLEAPAVRRVKGDDFFSQLVTAQILARIGTPDDVLQRLKTTRLSSRLMEQPWFVIIRSLSADALAHVVAHWDQLEDPYLAKAVLAVAARQDVTMASKWVDIACKSDSVELRIAGVALLVATPFPQARSRLLGLIRDEAWQVRARVCVCAELTQTPIGRKGLLKALADPHFWVRHHAATTLARGGGEAQSDLKQVATTLTDRYATDAARETLERECGWHAGSAE
ncbi:MAG: HEAT repeat domain-containing protein [Nannocystaceae bacterium]